VLAAAVIAPNDYAVFKWEATLRELPLESLTNFDPRLGHEATQWIVPTWTFLN
jgi:hypothetical protein